MRSLRSSIKGSGCRKPRRYKSFKSVVKNPLSSHCVTLKSKSRVGQSCPTLCDPWTGACQASLSMEFSRQEYWSGLAFFLQEIFSTQGLNPILLYCRQILYHLSHQGSPCDPKCLCPCIAVVIYKMRMIPPPLRVRYEDQMRKWKGNTNERINTTKLCYSKIFFVIWVLI